MACTDIVVCCPVCDTEITVAMVITIDAMPSSTQDWNGSVTVDRGPIQAHLLTHS